MGYFSNYNALIRKVDDFSEKIRARFPDEISCRKGCSSCCDKVLTLFPVEFFSIVDHIDVNGIDLERIKDNVMSVRGGQKKSCPFLYDDECLIYEGRPVICRTFGLPSITADSGNAELHVCDMNFKDIAVDIEKEYLLNLNTLNSMLAVVNMAFVCDYDKNYTGEDRLSVMDIVNYL